MNLIIISCLVPNNIKEPKFLLLSLLNAYHICVNIFFDYSGRGPLYTLEHLLNLYLYTIKEWNRIDKYMSLNRILPTYFVSIYHLENIFDT
jgi:hypothetical protein